MENNIERVIGKQRDYFLQGRTKSVTFRKNALIKLRLSIEQNLKPLMQAFKRDLNKHEFDVYSTEIMLVMKEIDYMIKNIKRFSKPKRVATSIINFRSHGKTLPEPYGVCLIVSPWNYPFQLAMIPLVGAIAGGNCAVLKPSSSSENVSQVIKKILSVFDESYISVALGDREENEKLFDQKFDFVFFTGGGRTAKELMSKLSKNLTPAVFELGGKSPCIVDQDSNIDIAARRVVWGKFLNAGQTCIAPDHVLVHTSIKSEFLERCMHYIKEFYYVGEKISDDFVHIISKRQMEWLSSLLDKDKIVFGGKVNEKLIEPTIMDNVTFEDKIMQHEIFGPIMPVLEFVSLDNVVEKLKTMPKPLALYYFGNDRKKQRFVLENLPFGGGCINDTIMHVSEHGLPFGGVGDSGMGNYHGKKTFDAFVHYKSVLVKSEKPDIKLKYPPHNQNKTKFVKWLSKL